jgi:RNA polymerase sigma-70 factor (ECF subfamily)
MPGRASNSSSDATFPNPGRGRRVPWWRGRRTLGAHATLTITDADLLPQCRRGDEAAWHELVARHSRKVFGLAYRFTGRVDEAEDLVQEVFVKVYQTLSRYREADGPFGAWLMAVARNHAIDHYRRRKQERLRRSEDTEVLERMPAHGEHPVAGLEREERAALVHRGLRALPPDLRLPLILCDLQGMPYEEIATRLSIPLGTVKSRINRARVELAKRLLARRGDLATGGDHRG